MIDKVIAVDEAIFIDKVIVIDEAIWTMLPMRPLWPARPMNLTMRPMGKEGR